MSAQRVGLIINPMAGAGGVLAQHGSDGLALVSTWSAERALVALGCLREGHALQWVCGPGGMGEEVLRSKGLQPQVLGLATAGPSRAQDTQDLAGQMAALGLDLLLFAGGDGTARDVLAGLGDMAELPVLGIPAGVKMQSACFGVSPAAAGRLAASFLASAARPLELREVMDMDEEALRRGQVLPRLFGYLASPVDPRWLQGRKTRSQPGDGQAAAALAQSLRAELALGVHLIGPGSTTWALKQALQLDGSLIGLDVVVDGQLWLRDANEAQLLELLKAMPRRARLWLTAIGGQGHVIGRGNAPLSARVLQTLGPQALTVLMTPAKLQSLTASFGGILRVDSACAEVDAMFSGPVQVLTGPRDRAVLRLVAA